MQKTPKSLRLQIGLFGRTNVGKSSFLNMVASQDVAITSPVPGTTTDVVEKSMELLPIGPVVFLDTAGLDDTSELSGLRIKKSNKVFDRADIFLLLTEPDKWSEYEDKILEEGKERKTPVIIIVNKIDIKTPSDEFLSELKNKTDKIITCSSIDSESRDKYLNILKKFLIEICPDEFISPPALIGDLMKPGGIAVLIVPIDLQAPKGRLILPQVQIIRDALDNDGSALVVKEREYAHILNSLKELPDIAICDSQVVMKMVADTPKDLKCTTFSIVFSRYKGDLVEAARSVKVIDRLNPGDKILIAEACSHHAIEDDIGRVKIPRWIRQYIGGNIDIDVYSGRDYPDNLKDYKLVIHCGGCMLTRREMLFRIHRAKQEGVGVTNYGVCISFVQGVLERVLSPFPAALESYKREA
jgi:[FeFe] hydrogenase H-cluster maturation GTPase HydF